MSRNPTNLIENIETSPFRTIIALAWPVTVSMLSYTAMSLADTLFVGRLGTAPLAALGLAIPALFLTIATGGGVLAGLRVAVAQAVGAGRHDETRLLAWQGMWLTLILGALGIALTPLGPLLFELQGASEEVMVNANTYFSVRQLMVPVVFASLSLVGFFQGRGDTRTPMIATISANAVNIALDPLLIFGMGPLPALGIQGAAVATAIAIVVEFAILAWCFVPFARISEMRWNRELCAQVVSIGAPMGAMRFLNVLGFTVFIGILARVGVAQLAAHVVVIRIISVSFLPGHAISEATSVLVGQAVGADSPISARLAHRFSTLLALIVMASWALVFVFIPEPLINVFDAGIQVSLIAQELMYIGALFQVLDAVAMVALGALNGAGDTRFTMIITVTCAWLVQIPLGLFLAFPMDLGAAGAWWGITVEILLIAIIGVWRIQGDHWLEQRVKAS